MRYHLVFFISMFLSAGAASAERLVLDIKPGARLQAVVEAVRQCGRDICESYDTERSFLRESVSDSRLLAKRDQVVRWLQGINSAAAKALEKTVRQVSTNRRFGYSLDYDLVRLQLVNNPVIDKPVQMVLRTEVDHVLIAGDTAATSIQFAPGVRLSSLSVAKNRAELYLIHGDGRVEIAGVAAFNNSKLLVPFGSTIYVPFKELTYKQNMTIAQLLANGGV